VDGFEEPGDDDGDEDLEAAISAFDLSVPRETELLMQA
jgi:hypothetical protein